MNSTMTIALASASTSATAGGAPRVDGAYVDGIRP